MKRNYIFQILIITILFSYGGTCYLSKFYVLDRLAGSTITTYVFPFLGYVLQAVGMFVYAKLFEKYYKNFKSPYSSLVILVIANLITVFFQLSNSVLGIIVFSLLFNFIYGMLTEIYLIHLTANIDSKHRGVCFGVSYAIGSIFTFLSTYFDGGEFVESSYMTIIYIVMLTIVSIIILKTDEIRIKDPVIVNKTTTKYIKLLAIGIIGLTVVMTLGDGIYNFGRWMSEVDYRIVRVFYGIGLILAGIVNDKSRRAGLAIAYSCLSYYLISTFMLNNPISPNTILSLSYFFMGFMAVYRYVAFADLVDIYPQYLSYCGLGLMISRIAEGFVTLILFLFSMSLHMHVIVTVFLYSPLVIMAIILDSIGFRQLNRTNENKFAEFSEKFSLTSREQEILKMIIDGDSDDEIANKIFISKPTVRFHISNILKKTHTKSRLEAKRLYEKQ